MQNINGTFITKKVTINMDLNICRYACMYVLCMYYVCIMYVCVSISISVYIFLQKVCEVQTSLPDRCDSPVLHSVTAVHFPRMPASHYKRPQRRPTPLAATHIGQYLNYFTTLTYTWSDANLTILISNHFKEMNSDENCCSCWACKYYHKYLCQILQTITNEF